MFRLDSFQPSAPSDFVAPHLSHLTDGRGGGKDGFGARYGSLAHSSCSICLSFATFFAASAAASCCAFSAANASAIKHKRFGSHLCFYY